MTGQEHPCAQGLTPACFEAHPEWAKRAFAYRLMHTLCPPRITRRLPKGLRLAYYTFPPDWTTDDPIPNGVTIDPTIVFPPGWTPGDPMPNGVTIDPTIVFPPGWTPGDPLPDVVTIDPTFVFPPDWTPGDPLPDVVTIDPTIVFPPDWTPGDPLPDVVTVNAYVIFPPDWTPDEPLPDGVTVDPPAKIPTPPGGAIPPLYVKIFEPGRLPKVPAYVTALKTWFWEPFDDFGTNEWTVYESGDGLAEITPENRLKLKSPISPDYSYVYRFGAYPYPENYNINIITHCIAGPGKTTFMFYTGSYRLIFIMEPNDRIGCYWAGGLIGADTADFMNRDVTWIIQVRAGHFNILQDGEEVVSLHQVQSADYMKGQMWIESGLAMETDIDEILILEYL